jgi:outer membrane lipase/esterase
MLDAAGIRIGPDAGLTYEKVKLDGYSEDSSLSTAASFGDQRLKNLTGRIGLAATSAPGAAARVLARVSYEHEFRDDDRHFSITPVGAPISYTSRIRSADGDYVSYAMAVDGDLGPGFTVRAGVRGQVGRSHFDSLTSFVGLSVGF